MVETMRAAVMRAPGGPDVLKIEEMPILHPQPGEVLIRVKAFGLNRSELYTRQGKSPGIKFLLACSGSRPLAWSRQRPAAN